MYDLKHIHFAYGAKSVLNALSLRFECGHFYGIIGPNGSGKTTLIDILAGHLRPDGGSIRFKRRSLNHYSRKELARCVALVPQDYGINFPYTCEEIVMMGRYPHIPRFSRPGAKDHAIVNTVMRQSDLEDFAHRHINRLSGGERQRVVFARALAQHAAVLLLDEATANLDMHHTMALMNLAAKRVSDHHVVIAVLQDINLAAMYCDRLVCMQAGRVFASGSIESVLTRETLKSVFHVDAHVHDHPYSQLLQVTFNRETIH